MGTLKGKVALVLGGTRGIDADFVAAAHRSIGALAGAIDVEAMVKGLVRPEHLHTGPSVRGSGVES